MPTEKVQKDKQRSTKHTCKTKDRVTRTPLKTGSELKCSGREVDYWKTEVITFVTQTAHSTITKYTIQSSNQSST